MSVKITGGNGERRRNIDCLLFIHEIRYKFCVAGEMKNSDWSFSDVMGHRTPVILASEICITFTFMHNFSMIILEISDK